MNLNIIAAFTHNMPRPDERIIMNHTKADETYAAKGVDLSGRNFLKLLDYTPDEIIYLIDLAAELKAMKKAGEAHDWLHGKNVVLLFEKTSTRTRCSLRGWRVWTWAWASTYLDPKSSPDGQEGVHRRHRPGAGPHV